MPEVNGVMFCDKFDCFNKATHVVRNVKCSRITDIVEQKVSSEVYQADRYLCKDHKNHIWEDLYAGKIEKL